MLTIIFSSALVFAAVLLALTSLGGAWDYLASRYLAEFKPRMDALSMDASHLHRYLRWWGLALVASFLALAIVFRMPPVAIAVGFLIFVAPRVILQWVIRRRRVLLRDQMVGVSVALSNCCRAGLTLPQGLETVSRESPEPVASELRRIVKDYEHGRPLAASIQETKQRLNEDSFSLFASAILVTLERGGRLTDALERISTSLQDSQRVERKLSSDTASGKTMVWLLSIFPFGFLAASLLMYPEGTNLMFQTFVGQMILAAIMVIVYFGFRWCQKIVTVDI